jgi:threonine synthase
MSLIKFFSTNGHFERVDFRQALLMGQAPDKGLFMPEQIPRIPESIIEEFPKMSYAQIAYEVVKPYLGDLITDSALRNMLQDAYDFEIPMEKNTCCDWITALPAPSRTLLPGSWVG